MPVDKILFNLSKNLDTYIINLIFIQVKVSDHLNYFQTLL